MTVPERYKETKRLQGRHSVEIVEGIDSVTGLPVLIYRFESTPRAGLDRFESENAPRLLWLDPSETSTSLVTALEPNWRYRSSENLPLQPSELVDLARALRDAAAVGLVHGDIRPERLLVTGNALQIEGFGVPWQPEPGPFTPPEIDGEPSESGDVWSLAAVIRKFGTTALDETTEAVLELCAAEDPGERPTAEELYLALERLLPEAVAAAESASVGTAATGEVAPHRAGEAGPEENDSEKGSIEKGSTEKGSAVNGSAEKGRVVSGSAVGGSAVVGSAAKGSAAKGSAAKGSAVEGSADSGRTSGAGGGKVGAGGEHGPGSGGGSGGGNAARSTREPDSGPPATSDVESSEGGDVRRRLALLGVLMAAVILLALLAVFGPRPGAVPALGRDATVYVVEFAVAPEDLPPVTIHLVSSPPGSSLSRGERLGTAPRHLALERGTWVFQGSLQERRSEPVEVQVPEQRFVTLSIPPVASGEDR